MDKWTKNANEKWTKNANDKWTKKLNRDILNLVPRVSHLNAPSGGDKMRDSGNEVEIF